MSEVTFVAAIIPVGKARARVTRRGTTYTPPATVRAEAAIRDAFRCAYPTRKPHEGPVEATVTAVFQAPVSWPRWKRSLALAGMWPCMHRIDVDNICKLATDSLNGVAYVDDHQIVAIHGTKTYGDAPRVRVTLRLLDEPVKPE